MNCSGQKKVRTSGASKGRNARGFALIEALVGILIFAFGVLGIVGLQASMTKAQTASKFRSDAAYLASELVGVMWSDINNLADYETSAGVPCVAARCADWVRKVDTMLPSTVTTVVVNAGNVTITIEWTVPGEGTHTYTTESAINA